MPTDQWHWGKVGFIVLINFLSFFSSSSSSCYLTLLEEMERKELIVFVYNSSQSQWIYLYSAKLSQWMSKYIFLFSCWLLFLLLLKFHSNIYLGFNPIKSFTCLSMKCNHICKIFKLLGVAHRKFSSRRLFDTVWKFRIGITTI